MEGTLPGTPRKNKNPLKEQTKESPALRSPFLQQPRAGGTSSQHPSQLAPRLPC